MATNDTSIPFPQERVYKTRADIYARSQGRELSDYAMHAVHVSACADNAFNTFLQKVPVAAEAVTEFDFRGIRPPTTNRPSITHVYGTALILKSEAKTQSPLAASTELPKESLEKTVAAMGHVMI